MRQMSLLAYFCFDALFLTMQRFMYAGQYDFMYSPLVPLDTRSGEKE